jgi:hexosaminidase
MKSRGWGQDFARLEQFYMQRLINVTQDVTKGDMRYLVWQEVIDNNVVLPTDTVIHVWKDGNKFHDELARVIFYNVFPLTHGYLLI